MNIMCTVVESIKKNSLTEYTNNSYALKMNRTLKMNFMPILNVC